MDIFEEEFSTGQVCVAADVRNATLQSWINREVPVGHKTGSRIEGGGSPGNYRRFSFFNVMEIAVGRALTDLGVDLHRAFEAAALFAHFGEPAGDLQRVPGVPFDGAVRTLLCVSRDQVTIVPWRPGEDIISGLRAAGAPLALTILEVDPIFEAVVSSLGHDPEQVKASAYSKVGA